MKLDCSVEKISVLMVQENTKNYPRVTPAEGYYIRPYREGDEYFWASVECQVDQFATMDEALACFRREFAYDPERMRTNCLFACDPHGIPVGFCSLWDGDTFGDTRLRFHWMAVDPAHQGKRISQSLLTALFDLYNAQGHEGFVYLITSTHSNQAIRLYKRFGFKAYKGAKPVNWSMDDYEAQNERAWEIIDRKNAEFDAVKKG